jgi:hypothetical protein
MAEAPGYGTTIGYATTSGGSYTSLAEVVSIDFPEFSVDDIETTHMLSTNKWKTFQAGLKDGGELGVTIHWDKTVMTTVMGTLLAADYFWKVTFNDITTGSTMIVPGYIKGVGAETPLDDIVTVALTIKVSGEPTYAAGS